MGSEFSFRQADLNDRSLFETLAGWYADPEIRAVMTPNRCEEPLTQPTPDQLMAGYRRQDKLVWFMFSQDRMIGEVTLDPDFPGLMRPEPKSAWISIIIGERGIWRQGAGTAAMRFLEATARSRGFRRIELGVFAFNERALALYRKLGYTEIGVTPRFTCWNGAWHDDIRLEKRLEPER